MSPLYAIVDTDACAAAGVDPGEAAAAMLRGGAVTLQLRAKGLEASATLALARRIAPLAAAAGATLLVNDRVDVARAAGLGVHLGQRDLPVIEARRLLGPAAVIGRSTHTPAELDAALAEPIDYVAYGPVFATRSKVRPDPVVGLDGVRGAARLAEAAGVPLVAIGGITLDTAPLVIAAGATAVAVIADLLHGAAPEARTRRFLSALAAKLV